MEYSDFSVEDFIMDDYFQQWVRNPGEEDSMFWDKWMREHPHKAEDIRQARMILLGLDFKKTPVERVPRERLLNRIRTTLHAPDDSRVASRRPPANLYYRAAAVLVGVFVSIATLYFLTFEPSTHYRTAFGEMRRLTLPDGSTMTLNANSVVRFDDDWHGANVREVWLEGEAFFDVRHTADDKKFIVRTDRLDVEVLGTEFNVRTREDRVQVVLNSGKVKLNTKGATDEALYMAPGELVELSPQNQVVKERVNPEDFSAWRRNELIFKATPLGEIAETLHHNYGWNISFEDQEMAAYQFTGTVSTESTEKVELLLMTISEAFGFEVEKEGSDIVFSRKKE